MSPILKDHIESFLLTFVATFFTSVGGLLVDSQPHDFSGAFALSLVISASQSAVRVAWNKVVFGTVAGRHA